jgi:hypothetical protein
MYSRVYFGTECLGIMPIDKLSYYFANDDFGNQYKLKSDILSDSEFIKDPNCIECEDGTLSLNFETMNILITKCGLCRNVEVKKRINNLSKKGWKIKWSEKT